MDNIQKLWEQEVELVAQKDNITTQQLDAIFFSTMTKAISPESQLSFVLDYDAYYYDYIIYRASGMTLGEATELIIKENQL